MSFIKELNKDDIVNFMEEHGVINQGAGDEVTAYGFNEGFDDGYGYYTGHFFKVDYPDSRYAFLTFYDYYPVAIREYIPGENVLRPVVNTERITERWRNHLIDTFGSEYYDELVKEMTANSLKEQSYIGAKKGKLKRRLNRDLRKLNE